MNELGELLKKLRGKRSLREAAKLTGLSYSYISSLEKGEHPKTKASIQASPDSLKSLAKAYNYPYEELMKMAGYIESPNQGASAEVTIQLLEEQAKKLGLSPDDPVFLKMLSDAFELLRIARGNNLD